MPRSFLILVLAVAAVAAPRPVVAEEAADPLTLEQAVRLALDANAALRASDARVGAARAGVQEARSLRLPRLALEGVAQHSDNPTLVFSNRLGQAGFRAQDFALGALNEPDPLGNWQARMRLSQPLWSGGRIRTGVEAAGLARDAAEADREADRQRLVHQVVEAYTGAVLARRELRVTGESLDTARAHVRLVADLHRGGLVVASDVLQAEVREGEVRELALRAESTAEVAVAALNLALGRDLDTPVVLPEELGNEAGAGADAGGDEPGDGAREAELARLVARGLEPPGLTCARRAAGARRARARSAWSARRTGPEVGLDASYEMNAEDFFGADGDNWTVTLGFAVDLFDGHRARARTRRAEEQAREAAESTELLAQAISLEVRRAYFERHSAGQRLAVAGKGVELAERSLEIVADRYREGLTILPELLDAETALTRARLRRIAAEREVLLARATLDLVTGDL